MLSLVYCRREIAVINPESTSVDEERAQAGGRAQGRQRASEGPAWPACASCLSGPDAG